MAATIRDVAALAGVSPSTVSRTCNDHPSISKETKEKVRRAMAQLGYEANIQPSPASQSPNPRRIGIVLPPSSRETYENAFYLEAIRGISQFCNGREYFSSVITGQDETEVLSAVRAQVKSGQVGGFIVLYSKQDDPVIDYLYSEGLLYVLVGKATQFASQTIYVDNDNLQGGQDATEYLYRLGHRKIAYVGSDAMMLFSSERRSGYQLALMRHGLPVRPDYCIEADEIPLLDHEGLKALLSGPDRPTAVVVSDDILAVALERLCNQMELRIPEDVSIVSFNNSLIARLTDPQLTSIDVNSYQLGIESASQLIKHIENPNLLATKTIVPHFLIERGSCRKLAAE